MHDHSESDLGAILDSRYVNVTGDTMTGDLNFNKTDSTSLITGDSSTFTSGIGSWVAWYGTMTMTASGGKGVLVGGASGGGYYIPVASVIVGRRYTATFTAQRTAGTSGYFALASGASGSTTITTSVTSYSITFTATSTTIGIVMAAGDTIELDDFTLYDTAIGDIVTNGFLRPYGATTGIKGLNATGDMHWGALFTSTTDTNVRSTYGTAGTKLLIAGEGASTNGLLSVHSTSTNARGTLAKFGYYSFWNMDSSGNTYWNWGARYNGTTAAWVRDYTANNNYLPYISYSTVDAIAIGGATSNDKTSLAPTMSTKFNFNVTATDPLLTASGRIFVDGVADAIQLRVQAHSSQTANLQTWENSSGTELVIIDKDGKLGIGTTAPDSPLHVVGNTPLKLERSGSYSFTFPIVSSGATAGLNFSSAGANSGYVFNTRNSSNTAITALTISGGGNVGIGTTAPVEKLHVIGNYQLSDNATPTKSYRFRTTGSGLDFDGAGNSIYLSVYDNADYTGTQRQYMIFGHLYDYVTCFRNWEWKDSSYNVQAQINPNGGFVFNEGGTSNLDFRVESDTEANMFFLDANADTDGALYLGGTTNGIKINKGGDLTLLGTAKYERHVQIKATPSGTPANQMSAVTIGTATGLQASSAVSQYAGFQWEVPDDWDGTDVYVEIDWFPDSGAMSGTDAIRWVVEYRAIAEGELITQGTVATVDNGSGGDTSDYAQYETKHTRFTLTYNHADQPLTAQDHVYFLVHRDVSVSGDFAGTVTVPAFEIIYNSKGFPTSN